MNKIKVSIITPAHNEEKIISGFIASAAAYIHKKKIFEFSGDNSPLSIMLIRADSVRDAQRLNFAHRQRPRVTAFLRMVPKKLITS